MLFELFYVSRSTLTPDDERAQIEHILAVARVRNLALGVTGALLHMNGRFAQVLEGPAAAVNQLTVAILRDARHADIRIVRVADIAERRFAAWSMAEIAPDRVVAEVMEALATPQADRSPGESADALIRYMATRSGSARIDPR